MNSEYLAHLYDALEQPLGIVLQTDNPERLRQKLYEIRREMSPTFDNISFVISPTGPQDQLWLVKKAPDPLDDL